MHRQILLTGATGALGPALAAELAHHHAAQHIAIMMRCPPAEISQRFALWRDTVQSLVPLHDLACLDRLHPVCGDICQDNLGLAASDTLQRETDVVIHAAADTNFSAPADRQWAVNVEGTQRMLDWAAKCRHLRRFLLVSSIYVSGSRTGRILETATAVAPDFITHYQRTKWVAEQRALQSGLPLAIARVSLILGSHATGTVHRTGAVHSLIKGFARGLLPMFPGLPAATGDVIATETAARFLSHAVMADWPARSDTPIWHVAASDDALKMTEITDFVYDQFAARPAWLKKGIPRTQLVEQSEFDRFIATVEASGHRAVAQALRSVNRFLPDLCFPKTYDTTEAESFWGGPGGGSRSMIGARPWPGSSASAALLGKETPMSQAPPPRTFRSLSWMPAAILLALLAGCADLGGLNKAIDDNRQAVTSSTQAIIANRDAIALATDGIRANQLAVAKTTEAIALNEVTVTKATRAIAENQQAIEATNDAIKRNADIVKQSTQAIADNAKVVQTSSDAIKKNADAIQASSDVIHKNGEAIALSSAAITENMKAAAASTDTIKKNGESVAATTAEILKNARQINASTEGLALNVDAVAKSTLTVVENERAVGKSAEGVKRNSEALSVLTDKLEGLSLDRPGTRLAAGLAVALVVGLFILLVVQVRTMAGIRRSLQRIEASMSAPARNSREDGAT